MITVDLGVRHFTLTTVFTTTTGFLMISSHKPKETKRNTQQ
jgi:hypothetical protein